MKNLEDYEDLCKNACDIVFDSLRFARKTASQPWRYLASFAASGYLFHHSSCFKDRLWKSVFLSVPKKRPQIVTEGKHALSILKAHFCFHAYGEKSVLFTRWMKYSNSHSPPDEEHPDFTPSPELLKLLIDLKILHSVDLNT